VEELVNFRGIRRSWGVIERGIYFVSYEESPQQTVQFLSFQTRKISALFLLEKPLASFGPALALSRDGRYALAAQLDHAVDDLMMIEDFR
jgi:hypothetical protein